MWNDNLPFFHIFQIISLFNWLVFHIFHIFSLFNVCLRYNWNIVESGVKHHKPHPLFTKTHTYLHINLHFYQNYRFYSIFASYFPILMSKWKDRENMEENSEMIWKIWKKGKSNSETIWKIQKKIVKRY
jgi:hypothetical protein